MQKTMGKCFRSKGNSITGLVRIFGSWYDYKVINGSPELGDMLEVIDFTSRELLVVINNKLEESDVNCTCDHCSLIHRQSNGRDRAAGGSKSRREFR